MTGDADVTLASRIVAAAQRTVAAGTARLSSAWCKGSPVPQPGDERCEGVADFAQRRAEVSGTAIRQRLMPEGTADKLAGLADTNPDLYAMVRMATEGHQVIYDGALELSRVDDRWFGILGDTDGPRDHNDPLWPLDALFGANDDAVEVAREPVRDTDTVRCRLTVDLLRADERLASGVSVPGGPFADCDRSPPRSGWTTPDSPAASPWVHTRRMCLRPAIRGAGGSPSSGTSASPSPSPHHAPARSLPSTKWT